MARKSTRRWMFLSATLVCAVLCASVAGLAGSHTAAAAQCYTPMVAASYWGVGLKSDGTVVAEGWNQYGQCDVDTWSDIVQVAAGGYHTLGLESGGTVVAVGRNDDGECDVGLWSDIVQVAGGGWVSVGLHSDGTVVATGYCTHGKCDVGFWTDVVQVEVGTIHTVGVKSDGTVVATGLNSYGCCEVDTWTDIVQVDAGQSHTVGLKSDGDVLAVGDNWAGQCDVDTWSDIVQVEAGPHHTVGLKSDGTVLAVGSNSFGQREVGTWTDIVQVAAGGYCTLGLKSDSTVVATPDCDGGVISSWDLGQPLHYTLEVTSDGCCDQVEIDDVVYDLPYSDTFVCDTEVKLAAVASPVCQFDSWSGDASGYTSTITITMDGDKAVVVNCSTVTKPPIGGTALPTDKLGLMMPWIVAAGALIVVAGVSLAIWNRKRGIERGRGR